MNLLTILLLLSQWEGTSGWENGFNKLWRIYGYQMLPKKTTVNIGSVSKKVQSIYSVNLYIDHTVIGNSEMDTLSIITGDSAKMYMKSDTLKLNPKQGSGYFDLRLWVLLFKAKEIQDAGDSLIRYKGTFPATHTCDTVVISGVASTNVIQPAWYGATIYNQGLRITYTTDTVFVYCDATDTVKARTEGFTLIRIK